MQPLTTIHTPPTTAKILAGSIMSIPKDGHQSEENKNLSKKGF
jgi:hypothetical protein